MPPVSGEQHLQRLGAAPRPTGTATAADARAYCRAVLQSLGYEVRDEPFEYSAFLGRFAMPVVGGSIIAIISIAAGLGLRGRPLGALAAVVIGLLALGGASLWANTLGVLRFPFIRATGTNLVAVPSAQPARLWLVAHLDSKWQPIPMLVRVLAITLLVPTVLAALVLSLIQIRSGGAAFFWPVVLFLAWIFGIPVMMSIVGSHSDGAVDNASGVATVLSAAATLSGVGVLITDAEELALAGAEAWRSNAASHAVAYLNCDSVDDTGSLTVMYHGSAPDAAARAFEAAARLEGVRARIMRVPLGMLTDSVALKKSGVPAATLSRGSIRTLWRVHSASDSLLHMKGSGIEEAARVLAAAARELL